MNCGHHLVRLPRSPHSRVYFVRLPFLGWTKGKPKGKNLDSTSWAPYSEAQMVEHVGGRVLVGFLACLKGKQVEGRNQAVPCKRPNCRSRGSMGWAKN